MRKGYGELCLIFREKLVDIVIDMAGKLHLAKQVVIDIAGKVHPAKQVVIDIAGKVHPAKRVVIDIAGKVHPAKRVVIDIAGKLHPAKPVGIIHKESQKMKKKNMIAAAVLMGLAVSAFSLVSEASDNADSKKVASDDAQMQTEDPEMPTRVIEEGTKILLHFGDTVIPGILNDCDTAKALIEKLPYTVHMNSYSHDFCGAMPDELPYNEEEVHYGWLNGDIDYAIDAPYFTILHSDEDNSEQYGYQVNIGVITCELSRIRDLDGSYDVLIELDEEAAGEALTEGSTEEE